jgi:hypothetical protein
MDYVVAAAVLAGVTVPVWSAAAPFLHHAGGGVLARHHLLVVFICVVGDDEGNIIAYRSSYLICMSIDYILLLIKGPFDTTPAPDSKQGSGGAVPNGYFLNWFSWGAERLGVVFMKKGGI